MKKAIVTVTLKRGILDPQGKAVGSSLASLGFAHVTGVRIGRSIEIELADGATEAEVDEMCRKLLSNPVTEDYRIEYQE